MRKRPPILTLFGIINIVLGVFGTIACVCALVVNVLPVAPLDDALFGLGDAASYGGLAVGGYGLLRMQLWGRVLCVLWALFRLVIEAMTAGYVVVWQLTSGPLVPGMSPWVTVISLFRTPESLAYPVVLLVVLFLPEIRRAFQPSMPGLAETTETAPGPVS